MITMRATEHFYDSNLNPKRVRRGHIFTVNDKVQAKDFEKLAVVENSDTPPAQPDATVPAGSVIGVERKAREVPLNKMNEKPTNKAS